MSIIMGLISGILGLFGCNGKTEVQSNYSKVTFEQQLETFKKLGFTLNTGISISDFNRWEKGLKEYEEPPYQLLYITLGQEIEREPWTPISNKCWNLDLESIEDAGSYVDIMENIERISNGELIFDNIKDYVEIEKGKCWVSFNCKGDKYKWNLKAENDWVDVEIFDKVQSLTEKYKTKGKFTFYSAGGQDFVLGYCTPEELTKLNQATGLNIQWLNAKEQFE